MSNGKKPIKSFASRLEMIFLLSSDKRDCFCFAFFFSGLSDTSDPMPIR